MGFARGLNALVPSASRIYVSGSLGWLVPPWHPKTRLNTNLCSESTFLAPEGTCYSKCPLQGHLVLQAPLFSAGVPKTRNTAQSPRHQGEALDAEGVEGNLVLPAPLFRGRSVNPECPAEPARSGRGTRR